MIQELKHKAMEHWQEWLPRKWAALVKEDRVDEELNRVARQAATEIRQWMDRGARQDEAEEIVLPQLILLKPEKGSWEQAEAEDAAREQTHQKMMRKEASLSRE